MKRAQPVVLNDLKRAQGRRSFSYALQYAGLVRSYLVGSDAETLNTFDRRVDEILADAPFPVPNDVRRRFGLASDADTTAQPALPGGVQQAPAPAEEPTQPSGTPPAGGGASPSSN
jgi:hypothetical protein